MEDARIHTSADTRSSGGRGCSGLDNPDEPLRCVFSTVTTIKVGAGTTVKKQKSKLLWYVKQQGGDCYGVRKINPHFVPVGEEKVIDQDELLSNYTPEVEIHNTRVEPAMCQLRKTVAKGDKYREQGKTHSAEVEYERALEVDVTNVRAIFGLGLVYLERGDRKKSRKVFEQLVGMKAAFDLRHKHLFNEFGIALRKNELYDEAVKYYSRAVELTEEDEHLYYNLSRVFYDMDDWEHCFEFTARALRLNPAFGHGLDMCRLMIGLAKNPALCKKYGKSAVPASVADGAGTFLTDDGGSDMIELGGVAFLDGSLEKTEKDA